MDPEMRNYNPEYGKRRASRSPENPLPSKAPKPNTREGSSILSIPYHSRQSSFSTGSPRTTLPCDPRGLDSRRPSYQTPSELRNEFSVNSPDSLGSRRSQYEEATSGVSTPSSNHGATGWPNATATNNGTSIIDVLMSFSAQTVQLARLEVHHEQGLSTVKQTMQEYNEMKKFFPDFPVIKEQKTTARTAAEKTLKAIEADINQGKTKQKKLVESIASLIEKSAEVRPTESRAQVCTDPASRTDNDHLLRKCGELEKVIRDATIGMRDSTSRSDKISEGMDAKLAAIDTHMAEMDRRITSLNSSTSQIISRTSNIENNISDILGLEIKSVLGQESKFQSKLKQLENNSNFGLRSAHPTSQAMNEAKDGTSELSRVIKTVAGLQNQMALLSHVVMGDENADFEATRTKDDCVLKQIHHLQCCLKRKDKIEAGLSPDRLEDVGDKVQVVSDDFADRESENDQVKSDIKDLREYLSGRVDGRLNNIEQAVRLLESSIPKAIHGRLQKLEKDVEAIDTSDGPLGKIEEVISKHIDEELKDIRDQLTALSQRQRDDLHAITVAKGEIEIKLVDLSTKVDAIGVSVAESFKLKEDVAKVSTAIGELRVDVDKKIDTEYVKGTLEAMKKLFQPIAPAPAHAPSRTPTPSFPLQAMQPPPQPSQSHAHIPSTSINRPPPSTSGFPPPSHNPATQTLAPNIQFAQDLKHLNDRCDALQIVTSTLQTRYNNLTTGDVCKAMLDQAADVWPHAKNFEHAVEGIKAVCTRQDRETEMLKTKIALLDEDVKNAVATAAHQGNDTAAESMRTASALADRAKNSVDIMEKGMAELDRRVVHTLATAVEAKSYAQREIDKLREALTAVQKKLKDVRLESPAVNDSTATEDLMTLRRRFEGLEDAMKQIEDKLKEAGILSKGHSSRSSNPTVEGMKKRLDDVVNEVRVLTETEGNLVETVSAQGKTVSEQGKILAAGKEDLNMVKEQIEQIKLLYAGLERQFEKVSKEFDWAE